MIEILETKLMLRNDMEILLSILKFEKFSVTCKSRISTLKLRSVLIKLRLRYDVFVGIFRLDVSIEKKRISNNLVVHRDY